MSTVKIQTSQNVTLEYEPASVGDRILAYLIDGLVMAAYVIIIFMLLGVSFFNINQTNSEQEEKALWGISVMMFMLLPLMFYHLLSEVFMNGQSIGKKAMNIRVVTLDGGAPSFGAYLIRWIIRLIDIHTFSGIIAIIVIISNKKGQRIGDIAANTTVVKLTQRVTLADLQRTDIHETYQVQFPQVEQLSDKDIETIRSVIQGYKQTGNLELIYQAADKMKMVLGVTSELDDLSFLQTIEKDYTHLSYGKD